MNELLICPACRATHDAASDTWWPPDCGNCEGRSGTATCEHICVWIEELRLDRSPDGRPVEQQSDT